MKIAFRADASIQIGTGHVMRCLTLADALRDHGAKTFFICRDLPGFSPKIVTSRGHDLQLLSAPEEKYKVSPDEPGHSGWLQESWEKGAEQTSHALQSLEQVDWLVVDHYALDFRWEAQLQPFVRQVMVVDDLADRKHECDLLVDQTLAASEECYRNLVPERCILLLGPLYAMLRPEFARYRDAAFEKRKQTSSIQKILVAMGGTDPFNVTDIALQGLGLLENKDLDVTVVLGSSAPHMGTVRKKAEEIELQVAVLSDVQNMAEIMVDHDLCIGSGGMTSWERCVLGLPSLTVTLAENQESINRELDAAGAIRHLGWFNAISPTDIRCQVEYIMSNLSVYNDMVSELRNICDGKGAQRILNQLNGKI